MGLVLNILLLIMMFINTYLLFKNERKNNMKGMIISVVSLIITVIGLAVSVSK